MPDYDRDEAVALAGAEYAFEGCPCERCKAAGLSRPLHRTGGECENCGDVLFFPGETCPCWEPLPFGWAHVYAIAAVAALAVFVTVVIELTGGWLTR